MRTKGSARFAPYYKVQWLDPRSAAWIDVQKSHATAQAAGEAFPAGKRCRVIEVSEKGRRPLPEASAAAKAPRRGGCLMFSDGEEFDTTGPLRAEHRADGWYVVGEGFLCPCDDRAEADHLIADLVQAGERRTR